MSKIICDICGTTYLSSSDSCPICGCSNEVAEDLLKDGVFSQGESKNKAGRFSSGGRKKEIFDYDEVNSPEDDDAYEEDEDAEEYVEEDYEEEDYEEEEDDRPQHNTFVIILLTILIVVLLGAAAFIFFRFFYPNMRSEEPVETTAAAVETVVPTTELTIPCEQMAMTNAGVAVLNAEGQQFLLHIKALPENTTDEIIYTSGNESVATVTSDGKITAVSEGETVIYISCGRHSIECPVFVKYVEETVPVTTEAVIEETVSETVSEEASLEETIAETTAPPSNVTLKLKKSDIRLGVYYEFQLELDCDLRPEDVTWSSEHPHIAKVDEQGNVTALKEGTTSIIAKYGDQEVQCLVRCAWY